MDADFSALLQDTSAVELQQVYRPPPATEPTLPELAQEFKEAGYDSLVTKLTDHFTDTRRENIKNRTKAQSKCSLWWKQRLGALTSTTLHLAAHYTRDSYDNYVADRIMGQCKFMGNAATEYGKKSEPVVRKLYVQTMKNEHRKLKVNDAGLFISERNPILRASPVGIVNCECCGTTN